MEDGGEWKWKGNGARGGYQRSVDRLLDLGELGRGAGNQGQSWPSTEGKPT